MFTVELASFMYRVSVLFLDCVLFKLNCALQVLRMEVTCYLIPYLISYGTYLLGINFWSLFRRLERESGNTLYWFIIPFTGKVLYLSIYWDSVASNYILINNLYTMQDFTKGFHEEPDVVITLGHHIRLRKQLRIISHRHRLFIISFLITTTASQFWTLLMTTRPHAQFNLFVGGELFVSLSFLLPFRKFFFYINFFGTIVDSLWNALCELWIPLWNPYWSPKTQVNMNKKK